MNMYEQVYAPTVGTAAIGRSLAVMSIIEFADDRVPVVYDAFPVRLGNLILRSEDTPQDAQRKLGIVEAAVEAGRPNQSEDVEPSTAAPASYTALKRAGLLTRTGDALAPAVHAAYEFKAVNLDIPFGEVTVRRHAEISRAHRIYTARVFGTMVQASAYEVIQQNPQATAEDWWDQLLRDLNLFHARTI